jgi:hypothetical protein
MQDPVVLPEAEPERDRERQDADDDPRAELVEVLDEAQPVLVLIGFSAVAMAGRRRYLRSETTSPSSGESSPSGRPSA